MKGPFLRTAVAVALLAGLGAYVFLVENKRPAATDAKPKEKVLALEKAKVKELTLQPKGEPLVKLVKVGEGWQMTEPLRVPADQTEVESLLSSLESAEIDEVVAEQPAEPADFGLAEPRTYVAVLSEGKAAPDRLALGDKTPDSGGVYARAGERPRVFTIASYLESTFTKKAFDLRDRSVLHVKRDAVQTLEVAGKAGGFALAREPQGEWKFTRPLATLAGRWTVDGLLGSLENLRMESVVAEQAADLEPFGLDQPAHTVRLGLADGSVKTLEIGAPVKDKDKQYHARETGGGLVVAIPGALVDDLAKGLGEYRAKRLLDVTTYDVEGLEIEGEGLAKRTLARSTEKDKEGVEVSKWKRTAPDAKDLETSKVQDALFQIGGAEAQEFIDAPQAPGAYGLDKPALRVSLRYTGGKPAGWFEIGQKDGAAYARRSGDESVLKLDAAKAADLVKAFKEL
jgi:hypothetical protein